MAHFTRTVTLHGTPPDKPAMRAVVLSAFANAGFVFTGPLTVAQDVFYYQNGIPIPNSSKTFCFALKFSDNQALNGAEWLSVTVADSINTTTGVLTGGIWSGTLSMGTSSSSNSDLITTESFAPDAEDTGRFRFVSLERGNTGTSYRILGYCCPYLNTTPAYNPAVHNLTYLVNNTQTSTSFGGLLAPHLPALPFPGATTFTVVTNTYPVDEAVGAQTTYFYPLFAFYVGNGGNGNNVPIGSLGNNIRFGSSINSILKSLDRTGQWERVCGSGNSGGIYLKVATV